MSEKFLTLGLSGLVGVAVLLGGCASSPPPEPIATAPPPPAQVVSVAPQPPAYATTTVTTYPSYPAYPSVAVAPTAPPPARDELIPPSPGPQMVWEPGYWSFNGSGWNWIPGHYAARPQPAAQWIPGHWAQQSDGSWVWIAGQWAS